jgi:hypothetical protein
VSFSSGVLIGSSGGRSEQCTNEIYGYEAVLTKEMDYSGISLFQTI